jgi:hypothetical protein
MRGLAMLPEQRPQPWLRKHGLRAFEVTGPLQKVYESIHDAFDEIFGDEEYDDTLRLEKPLRYTLPNSIEAMSSEGEVTRLFHTRISSQVNLAWTSFPRVVLSDQIGLRATPTSPAPWIFATVLATPLLLPWAS